MKIQGDGCIIESDDAAQAIRAALDSFEFASVEDTRDWALNTINAWRGQRRAALGLTSTEFQELVYTGKFLMCILWLYDQATGLFFSAITNYVTGLGLSLPPGFGQFPCHNEAVSRGISDVQMALLILAQGFGWLAPSDQIEAAYITARAAVLAAADEAAIAAVLAGLQ